MWHLLFILGYVTLIGPPRALHMKVEADNDPESELAKLPLWSIALGEFALRGGLFLVSAATLEYVMGDALFERLHTDVFLGALMIAGFAHTTTFYLCFAVFNHRLDRSERVYRLARNFYYSVLPGFPAVALCFFWEQAQKVKLSETVYLGTFFSVWALFAAAGVIEWLITKRHPRGLGKNFTTVVKALDH